MRFRTGHAPSDWSPNEPAEHVSRTARSTLGGSLVTYAPKRTMSELQRQAIREARARTEASRRYRARPG